MADWSDIAFSFAQTDYIADLEQLRIRSQTVATEVEQAHGGSASLSARLALLVASSGLTANLSAGGWRITGLGDPVDPQDAATRAWVAAQLVGGGSPADIPITSLNVGTLADGDVAVRSGAGVSGRSLVSISLDELGAVGIPDGHVPVSLTQGVVYVPLIAAAVGLGNVNDVADADKPVSTAQQAALDEKASLSGAAFTGPVTLAGVLAGYLGVPMTTRASGYVYTRDDLGRGARKATTAAHTFTIPADATEAFTDADDGAIVAGFNVAASGNISLVGAAGVTLHLAGTAMTGTRTVAPWGGFTAIRVGANRWFVAGPGVT
ncbi:MAG: hypothetical protein Q8L45_01755 [Xanthomonadaceae bacterium]|nr:hypothetical protein [Xanthomonadaceae bacterium]MDP2185014.1 hypothetical protein [Xanthomonadales bacterium]MDZ4116278.1 hypothetical protein [Xanthomonadaceae bacterium]